MSRLFSTAALLTTFLLAGCGGEDKPDPVSEVRSTLTTFASAVEQRDYATICDRIFSAELLRGIQGIGLPCEVALKNSLGEVREPKLTIGEITVAESGREATAEIRTSAAGQPPSSDDLHLERIDGSWRISELNAEAPDASPTPTPTPKASRTPGAKPD